MIVKEKIDINLIGINFLVDYVKVFSKNFQILKLHFKYKMLIENFKSFPINGIFFLLEKEIFEFKRKIFSVSPEMFSH